MAGATGRTCNRVRHGELVTPVQGYDRVAYAIRRVHHACGLLLCGSAPILLHSAVMLERAYYTEYSAGIIRICLEIRAYAGNPFVRGPEAYEEACRDLLSSDPKMFEGLSKKVLAIG